MSKSGRVGIKPPAPAVSVQCGRVGPGDRSVMGNLSTENEPPKNCLATGYPYHSSVRFC